MQEERFNWAQSFNGLGAGWLPLSHRGYGEVGHYDSGNTRWRLLTSQRPGTGQRVCAKEFHPSSSFILIWPPACGIFLSIFKIGLPNSPRTYPEVRGTNFQVSLRSNQVHNQNAAQTPGNLLGERLRSLVHPLCPLEMQNPDTGKIFQRTKVWLCKQEDWTLNL